MKAVFILPCLLSCGLLAAQNTQPRDSISGGTINESMIQADRQSLTGLTRIDGRFVRTLPAFMGESDVLKAVQFIPGISGGKEGNVGVNYHIFHRRAESVLSLSVYNCYNRMNPYTVQYGYDKSGQLGLYNVCIMPLMPALSYAIKF